MSQKHLSLQPYKGSRDFFPEEKNLQLAIFKKWTDVVESFGYQPYDAPILEPLDLYLSKTSEEIINEQVYTFTDRGGREVAIRPEMTPTVSRMVASRRQQLAYPLRLYSIPNLWRYERPQRGRLREHWQLNVDLFGLAGIQAEIEILQVVSKLMSTFGADPSSYKIRLNHRQLTNLILSSLEIETELHPSIIRLIDQINKLPTDKFEQELRLLCSDKTNLLLKIISSSTPDEISQLIPKTPELEHCLLQIESLMGLNIPSLEFDPSLMRGFDYYTGIVFEVFDTNPLNNRSLFGGGRYDGLVSKFGVDPLPVIGFGLGDVSFTNFLQTHNLLPKIDQKIDYCIIFAGTSYADCLPIINQLQQQGKNIATADHTKKISDQLKYASKNNYTDVLIIGEQELATNQLTHKNLTTGQQNVIILNCLS